MGCTWPGALHRALPSGVSLTDIRRPPGHGDQRNGHAALMPALYGRMRSIGEAGEVNDDH